VNFDGVLATSVKPPSSNSSSSVPTKIGKGYRLVSIEEVPDGGFVAFLQVKKKNKIYGPDIPNLRLFVKWVFSISTVLPYFSYFLGQIMLRLEIYICLFAFLPLSSGMKRWSG